MIKSIEEFFQAVRTDSSPWHRKEPKWFRDEPESEKPLLPTLYRDNLAAFENPLLQMFRTRAPGYYDSVPDVTRTDQWLFLARHAGLPTRLLDWTEGALIGLHFALKFEKPVIWMLNPLELNQLAGIAYEPGVLREFPLAWIERRPPQINPAFENLAGAWELDNRGVQFPVAVYPTYVHARLRAQRSCFTIHGREKQSLNELIPERILKRYAIDPGSRQAMINELRLLGVSDSVVLPDLDGLALELKTQFL